jgi:hypothetical protein
MCWFLLYRFEEEILTSQLVPGAVNGGNVTAKAAPPSSKPDIGPITLERVQAHLASKPLAPPPPPPPPSTVALKSAESIPKSVLAGEQLPSIIYTVCKSIGYSVFLHSVMYIIIS